MSSKPFLAAVACVAACGTFAAPALAAKKPTPKQTRSIERAVKAMPEVQNLPRGSYKIVGERVSTVSRFWASAHIRPRTGFEGTFDDGEIILVRPADSRRWVPLEIGTGYVGCGVAPVRVISDLRGVTTSEACWGDDGADL